MNAPAKQVSIVDQLFKLEDTFNKQNSYKLKFEQECLFAKQQILKNDFTLKTAENNQGSLRSAILNVAAIGISLNPATSHAYLVPRDGMICLDISYRGLVKLATDSGSIQWAKAVLVYEGDKFTWNGVNREPTHEADVFNAERIDAADPIKNLKGGYCIAKLADGEYMVEVMTAGEIIEVRNSSKAQNGPWKGKWAGEMAKKTLVKRAYKSWPQSGGMARLADAIEILNAHEGLKEEEKTAAEFLHHSPEQKAQLTDMVQGDPTLFYLWWTGLDERIRTSLYHSFEKGEKGKAQKAIDGLARQGFDTFTAMKDAILEGYRNSDESAVLEIIEDESDVVIAALLDAINDTAVSSFVNIIIQEAA